MAVTPEQVRDALQVVTNSLQHQRELFMAFGVAAANAVQNLDDVLDHIGQLDDNPPRQEPAEDATPEEMLIESLERHRLQYVAAGAERALDDVLDRVRASTEKRPTD